MPGLKVVYIISAHIPLGRTYQMAAPIPRETGKYSLTECLGGKENSWPVSTI